MYYAKNKKKLCWLCKVHIAEQEEGFYYQSRPACKSCWELKCAAYLRNKNNVPLYFVC